eukprot:493790_1
MSESDEEKENKDIDEDVNDGYKHVQQIDNMLPTDLNSKRSKQNESNKQNAKIEIMKKLLVVTRGEETDKIQKCIGQVLVAYEKGSKIYRFGTGTIYKQSDRKYYLAITCAHNLVYFNDRNNRTQNVEKIFYLPNGVQDQ